MTNKDFVVKILKGTLVDSFLVLGTLSVIICAAFYLVILMSLLLHGHLWLGLGLLLSTGIGVIFCANVYKAMRNE